MFALLLFSKEISIDFVGKLKPTSKACKICFKLQLARDKVFT